MNPARYDITISIDQDSNLPDSEHSMFIITTDLHTAEKLMEVYDSNGKEVWIA